MTAFVLAAATGLFIWGSARQIPIQYVALGWGVGIIARNPAIMVTGMLEGAGWALYFKARDFERRRDAEEKEAAFLLQRLSQLLSIRGTLAGALDEMGYRVVAAGVDTGERVLEQLAAYYRVGALTMVSRTASVVRRYGGSLVPVAQWASQQLQQGQAQRLQRGVEDAARRSTIVLLALAPVAIVLVFFLLLPSFYRELTQTALGDGAILMVGLTTAVVFGVLAHQMGREAQQR